MKGLSVVACLLLLAVEETTFAFRPLSTAGYVNRDKGKSLVLSSSRRKPFKQGPCHSVRSSSVGPLAVSASPLAGLLASPVASPLGAVAILAGIILVHESGHYLAARSFGIKVEEFSIGFGPKIAGFQALGNEFNLRALPLGGYVRFPENYNATLVAEQEAERDRKMQEFRKQNKKESDRSVGDNMLNLLTFGALQERRRRKEEQRLSQEPEESLKLSWWRRILTKPQKDELVPERAPPANVEIEYDTNPDLLQNRSWRQRAVVLSAGVIFNLVLSFCLFFGEIGFGAGLPRPVFEAGAYVSAPPLPGAPATGILHEGDIIVGVDGEALTISRSPTAYEAQRSVNDFISKIRSTPDGDSIQLSVVRQGSNQDKPLDVRVKPQHAASDSPQSIGVLLTPNLVKTEIRRSDSLVEAAGLATQNVAELTRETASGLLAFFSQVGSGKSSSSWGSQVSGPIGLIRTGSEVVATQDFTSVVIFAAAISINLGVINAFPLPALDGGQLVFVLAEAVTGRKVDQQVQEGLTGITLVLLLLASAGAAVGDIGSIVVGR